MTTPTDRDDANPFEAPRSAAGPAHDRQNRRPWVFVAYAIYCGFGALICCAIASTAAVDLLFGLADDPDRPADAGTFVVVSMVAALLYGTGPSLPRRPWAWSYGLIVILLGIAISWPLLAFWLRRKTHRYYGMMDE